MNTLAKLAIAAAAVVASRSSGSICCPGSVATSGRGDRDAVALARRRTSQAPSASHRLSACRCAGAGPSHAD